MKCSLNSGIRFTLSSAFRISLSFLEKKKKLFHYAFSGNIVSNNAGLSIVE